MIKQVVATGASAGEGPYSQGIAANGFVFVSGQGPLDPVTGAIVGATIEEQAELTLRNVKYILEAAGSGTNLVVKVCVYLADMGHFQRFNEVYRRFFSKPLPARTCVGVQLDGILVEVDAIAVIRDVGGDPEHE